MIFIFPTENSESNELSDYTVIDTEFTPLPNGNGNSIFQLGALKIRNGIPIDNGINIDINPQCPLGTWQLMNTNMTDEYLQTCPLIDDVIEQFINYIGDDVIAGANVLNSDIRLIDKAYYNHCNRHFDNDFIDITQYSKNVSMPLEKRNMETLMNFFKFGKVKHNALDDCIDEYRIFEKLKKLPKCDNSINLLNKSLKTNNIKTKKQKYNEISIDSVSVLEDDYFKKLIVAFTCCRPDEELYYKMLMCGFKKENEREQWRNDINLVVKENTNTESGKTKKAIEKNIRIITYEEFVNLVNNTYKNIYK